jgi:para-nitrobenzyl esterase
LNVYAPATAASKGSSLPVMLFIHGGNFQAGDGGQSGVSDVAFSKGEVIVVAINYRLALFGFLAADELRGRDSNNSTGNYGWCFCCFFVG